MWWRRGSRGEHGSGLVQWNTRSVGREGDPCMLPLVIAMSLAQPAAAASPPAAAAVHYVILGDEARRNRVERLIGELARSGVASTPAAEGGMGYSGCVSPWQRHPEQVTLCIQSRIATDSRRGTIVLNSYEPADREGEIRIACVGAGGQGVMTLRSRSDATEPVALRRCLSAAAYPAGVASHARHAVRSVEAFAFLDAARARTSAVSVLKVAMDHVGVPRGTTGGCLIQGRVVGLVRGPGLSPSGRIEFSVPCSAAPDPRGPRRIWMGDLQEGSFAHLHLDERNEILDIEPAPH
jgi:hypothetical protein